MADTWTKGSDGEVSFDGDHVRIKRSGFLSLAKGAGRGEIAVHISQVSGVELKKPGLTAGRFTILTAGTNMAVGSSISQQRRLDPMTVVFQTWHHDAFKALRDRIEQAIAERARPQPTQGGDLASQLQQLAVLHQQGALSDVEYRQAKARLLS